MPLKRLSEIAAPPDTLRKTIFPNQHPRAIQAAVGLSGPSVSLAYGFAARLRSRLLTTRCLHPRERPSNTL
jgi:hypothetical protein